MGLSQGFLRFFRYYARWSGLLSKGSFIVCIALLSVLTLLVVVSVIFRYLLSQPLQWSEEASRYLLVWIVLIGASLALRKRQHVNLDFLLVRVSSRTALLVELALYLIVIGIVFQVWLLSVFWVADYSFRTYSASLQIRMFWAHGALPVGFFLILIQSVYVLLEDIKRLLLKRPYPHTIDPKKG